jgi:hypothetical protein
LASVADLSYCTALIYVGSASFGVREKEDLIAPVEAVHGF